jgi:hypothetical protein
MLCSCDAHRAATRGSPASRVDRPPVESVEVTAVSDDGFLFVPPVLSIPNAR